MTITQTELFKPLARPVVSGHGYGSAEIFFLAGFPSKTDLVNGLALTGHAENSLASFLHSQKVSLKNCYRSTFIKEQLSYSGTNSRKLREALEKVDYQGYLDLLYEELKTVSPNVIVTLDDISLGAVFPHITQLHKPKGRTYWSYCYRGSILALRADFSNRIAKTIKIIPTLHPTFLEIDWAYRAIVNQDFKKIVEWSKSTLPIEEYGFTWVARTAGAFDEFLKRQLSKNPKRVTFDIETYGGLLTCISFCFDGYEAVTVPLIDASISSLELALLWRLVGKILADPTLEKNNQNIKYDWTILERFGFNLVNVRSDTMLKTNLLYPELPKGLDFLTSIYTPVPYYKDEGKEFNPKLHTRDRLYLYCAKDSLTAHIISEKQDIELEENNLKTLYEAELAPSIIVYKNIDISGILVSQEQKTKLFNKYTYLYESNLSILRGLTGRPDFNPASPKQVGEFIYEELKFPIRQKTLENGVKSYNTNKETLDDLLINHPEANRAGKVGTTILSRITLCRKLAKVLEYIDTPLHPDGTFRSSSNLAGTETGRSSFSKTIDETILGQQRNNKWTRRLGRSLQTITKHGFEVDGDLFEDYESCTIADDLRSMFVPHRNFVFIEGDGKGAEARAVFVLAEDYDALAAMDTKPSLHAKTIGMIMGVDPKDITKTTPTVPKINVPYYELGKRIRHAGHNGMEAFRLAMYIHMPLPFCADLMRKFHESNPKIKLNFHGPIIELGRRTRTLVCPNLRRRDFFGRLSKHTDNEMLCYIQQATISDTTKFTMHRMADSLKDGYMTKFKFLAEMHDGVLAEVHKDYTIPYISEFKRLYERPIDFRRCSLPRDYELIIPAEMAISSTNWHEMKEFEI